MNKQIKIKFDSLKALEVFGENFEKNIRIVGDLLEQGFEVEIFMIENKLRITGY